jgi:hypothetical protein
MNRAFRFMMTALLLGGSALLIACSNDIGANGAESTGKSFDSRKYWDRCINGECPPMNETDARKK